MRSTAFLILAFVWMVPGGADPTYEEEEGNDACQEEAGREMFQKRTATGTVSTDEQKEQVRTLMTKSINASNSTGYLVLSNRGGVLKCPISSEILEIDMEWEGGVADWNEINDCEVVGGSNAGGIFYQNTPERRRRASFPSFTTDATGNFLMPNVLSDTVQRCGPSSLERGCVTVAGPDGFFFPWSVTVLEDGDYLVIDAWHYDVHKCSAAFPGPNCSIVAGGSSCALSGPTTNDKLCKPRDMVIDAAGDYVFAVDSGVQKCTPSFSNCTIHTYFSSPISTTRGIAIDSAGDYIVTTPQSIHKCFSSCPGSECVTLFEKGTYCDAFGPHNGLDCEGWDNHDVWYEIVRINSAGEMFIVTWDHIWKCSPMGTNCHLIMNTHKVACQDILFMEPTVAPTPSDQPPPIPVPTECPPLLPGMPTPAPTPVPPTPVPTASPTPAPTYPPLVALKGGKNGLYCADEKSKVVCDRHEIGAWEKFTIEDVGDGKVALKGGQFGKYCRDRADKEKIRCNSDNVGDREKFEIQDLGGGLVAIKGGLYGLFCKDKGDTIVCDQPDAQEKETFTMESLL